MIKGRDRSASLSFPERSEDTLDDRTAAMIRQVWPRQVVFLLSVAALLFAPALVWRLINEDRVLRRGLPGYADHCRRVRWRLVPGVW